jgi:hypothetical protein
MTLTVSDIGFTVVTGFVVGAGVAGISACWVHPATRRVTHIRMMKTGRNVNFMDIHLTVNRNRLEIKGDNIFFAFKVKP